jgi:hypothetical protein
VEKPALLLLATYMHMIHTRRSSSLIPRFEIGFVGKAGDKQKLMTTNNYYANLDLNEITFLGNVPSQKWTSASSEREPKSNSVHSGRRSRFWRAFNS